MNLTVMKNLISCRVNVMVSDMDRAVGFYHEKLGLELINSYGNHYAGIQAPDLLIGLHPASGKTVFGNNLSIGLGVTDFDVTVQALQAEGISFNQLFLAERKDT